MLNQNATWFDVCDLTDIPDGGMLQVKHDEKNIVMYHVDEGIFATDNICSHAFALLSEGWLQDGLIECPLHGALFDIKTGEVKRGPAECGVKSYPVKEENGRVFCALPPPAEA